MLEGSGVGGGYLNNRGDAGGWAKLHLAFALWECWPFPNG